MNKPLRHLVDPLDLSKEETRRLLDLADSIADNRENPRNAVLRAQHAHAPEL